MVPHLSHDLTQSQQWPDSVPSRFRHKNGLTDDAVRFGDELETPGAPVPFGKLSQGGLAHLLGVDDCILVDHQLRRLTAVDLQDPPVLLALVMTDKVKILGGGWRRGSIRRDFATFSH